MVVFNWQQTGGNHPKKACPRQSETGRQAQAGSPGQARWRNAEPSWGRSPGASVLSRNVARSPTATLQGATRLSDCTSCMSASSRWPCSRACLAPPCGQPQCDVSPGDRRGPVCSRWLSCSPGPAGGTATPGATHGGDAGLARAGVSLGLSTGGAASSPPRTGPRGEAWKGEAVGLKSHTKPAGQARDSRHQETWPIPRLQAPLLREGLWSCGLSPSSSPCEGETHPLLGHKQP